MAEAELPDYKWHTGEDGSVTYETTEEGAKKAKHGIVHKSITVTPLDTGGDEDDGESTSSGASNPPTPSPKSGYAGGPRSIKRRFNPYSNEGLHWRARYRAPRFSRTGNQYAAYSVGVSPDLVFIAGIGLIIAANSKNGVIRDVYRLIAGGNLGVDVLADFKVLGAELLFIFILSFIAKTSPNAANVIFALIVGLWMVWAIVNADTLSKFSKTLIGNLTTVQKNQQKQQQNNQNKNNSNNQNKGK